MLGGEAWDLSSGFNMMLGCAFEERVSFALDPEEGKGTFDFEIDSIAMTLWESASEFFLGTADKDCESLLSAIEKVSVSKCEADYISRRALFFRHAFHQPSMRNLLDLCQQVGMLGKSPLPLALLASIVNPSYQLSKKVSVSKYGAVYISHWKVSFLHACHQPLMRDLLDSSQARMLGVSLPTSI
jgi:hypothetical protein